MISLKDFTDFERRAVIDYLASLPPRDLKVDFAHDAVFVEAEFTREFFSDLQEREITAAAAEGSSGHGGASDGGVDLRDSFVSGGMVSGTSSVPAGAAPPAKSAAWLLKLVGDFYVFRWKQFHLDLQAHHVRPFAIVDDVSVHMFQFLSKRFGVASLVKRAAQELLDAVRFYRSTLLDLQLFGVLLSGAAYNTNDLQMLLAARNTLTPYVVNRQVTLELGAGGGAGALAPQTVTVRSVAVRDIPYLLRKCLAAAKCSDAVALRVRRALATWCDERFRFPATVPDPNFYAPPYPRDTPYIGATDEKSASASPSAGEGRFAHAEPKLVVDEAQLLTLLLLNHKQEQISPTPPEALLAFARRKRATTPTAVAGRAVVPSSGPGASGAGGGAAPARSGPSPSLLERTLSSTLRNIATNTPTRRGFQSSSSNSASLAATMTLGSGAPGFGGGKAGDGLARQHSSPALKRRDSMRQAASFVSAPLLASLKCIDLPPDFDPFRASPTTASPSPTMRGARAVSVPLDLALDVPFVSEGGGDGGSGAGAASAAGWGSPPSPIAAPFDLHNGSTTLEMSPSNMLNLSDMQASHDDEVRALESRLRSMMNNFSHGK